MSSDNHLIHPKYRPDIDGLRAVAVLFVICFHAFPGFMKGGFIGVDIFFVISGYLISTIIINSLDAGSFSFSEFYQRRIRRIFPALILLLLGVFIAGWFVQFPDDYALLGKNIAGGAGFVSNLLYMTEDSYFGATAIMQPLLHLWSLGVEEQFYLIWPVILWFAYRRKWNLVIVTTSIAAASFAYGIYEIYHDYQAAFYSPLARFWELMCGALLAVNRSEILPTLRKKTDGYLRRVFRRDNPDGKTLRSAQSILGAVIIIALAFALKGEKDFPGWWAVLPVLSAVLIISAGPDAWFNRTILSRRTMVWFGLISYPLYLWHWSLLSFARITSTGKTPTELRWAAILLSVLLAWLTYRFVEKHLRFGQHGKEKAIALFLIIAAIGGAGYYTHHNGGWPQRYPKIIADIIHRPRDYKNDYRHETCFLNLVKQDYTAFKNCEVLPGKSNQTVLLWGDSHAAHLYPGYKLFYGDTVRFLQRNGSGCPPLLDMDFNDYPNCRAMNDDVMSLVQKEKPQKVILAAIWGNYDWRKLTDTIARLRAQGVKDIDIIGPVPAWQETLPMQLYAVYKDTGDIPLRMNIGLNTGFMQLDDQMVVFAKEKHVNYISPRRILCNADGCLTRLGDNNESLIAWAYCHLTQKGSEYLVSRFPKPAP